MPRLTPSSARNIRTNRSAWVFSTSEHRRDEDLPAVRSTAMAPFPLPSSGASTKVGDSINWGYRGLVGALAVP